jgi:hypothetical protein
MGAEGQMARGGAARESTLQGPPSESLSEQYSLKILGIWAVAALPMALLAWVIGPMIIPLFPLHPGINNWLLIIAGMMWQFVVALAFGPARYRRQSSATAEITSIPESTPSGPRTAQRGPYWPGPSPRGVRSSAASSPRPASSPRRAARPGR